MSTAFKGIAILYLIVGALHSAMFDLVISRTSCLTARGLVGIYCSMGMGISHAAITLAWPLYWLQETKVAEAQRLTGSARSEGIARIANSCMSTYGKGNTGMVPRPLYEEYCRCYAEGLLDRLSPDELKDADSPKANLVIQEEGKRKL